MLKTATTKAIQKTTGSTAGNLIGNKIEDAVVQSFDELLRTLPSKTEDGEFEKSIDIPKEKYISPEKRQHIIGQHQLI